MRHNPEPEAAILDGCIQSLIPNYWSAFGWDRWHHISIFISLALKETDSCHRQCHARLTPSPGSADGFSKAVFGSRPSTRPRFEDFWTAIPALFTTLSPPPS